MDRRRLPPLNALRAFETAARHMNFTRAAEVLHIAQPPLSRQIQALEEEFGVALIDRGSRPLALTDAGKLVFEQAVQVLDRLDEMKAMVRRLREAERARFSIGFVASTLYGYLPEVIRRYRAARPGVELTLLELTTMEQIAALKDGRIDVGFGRIPFTDAGKKANRDANPDSFSDPERRPPEERCMTAIGSPEGPPMMNTGFNGNYQILQTPDYVAILVEMNHDVRVIRLNAEHRKDDSRPYFGDSVGHWEGDTLVVETTNIPQAQNFMGSWKHLKVTERFTRVGAQRLRYAFTVEDADTWDKPWGGEYEFGPMPGIIYEYACHEGNYALPGMLGGARRQEKEAAAKAGGAPGGGR
jgi:DNA-binding Lrp family transcriptional regulator